MHVLDSKGAPGTNNYSIAYSGPTNKLPLNSALHQQLQLSLSWPNNSTVKQINNLLSAPGTNNCSIAHPGPTNKQLSK
jgi:hypothetical protein